MAASIPIKSIEEIDLIKDLYRKKGKLLYLIMFTLDINTGLSLVDLLNLKVKDVKDKYYISCGKQKRIPLNNEIMQLVKEFIKDKKMSEFLFKGPKDKLIARTWIFQDFKAHLDELGLREKYSVASWRKTFAYHYYQRYKDISYLMWLFNQNTVSVAFSFIDVEENMNLRFREGVCL